MTSAPQSASIAVAIGPCCQIVRSRTRMPSRAFISDCKIAQALRRSLSGGPQLLDYQRQRFTSRPAQDYITEAGQRRLVRVDFNEGAAARLNVDGKLCGRVRSEEHTSELQSRFDLVCRLLLEKKK